jgi:cell division GTPase FtsZ
VKVLLLSTGGGGGNILRSLKTLFDLDLAVTEEADSGYAKRLREAVTTRFLDTNEFSLSDVPPEERVVIGARTTGRLGARHDPDVARQALDESRSEVESLLGQFPIIVLIGTGGKGTGAGTMFPLAELARKQRKLVLPIFVRPSFERHEVDKRRYDHALNVIERFDAAKIRLIEIVNDRGYTEKSPQPQSIVWERMNLPIARGLRGLIYVLWELQQVDPSDLSVLFAGQGRLRIGYADIDTPEGQEPSDPEIEQAARRCWANPYYAFSKPPGTSLVCIQGEWSNVVDARIKGQLAALAMAGNNNTPYTPLYARAGVSPRPWGVTMLMAEYTGAHPPLEIDWSFARETQPQTIAALNASQKIWHEPAAAAGVALERPAPRDTRTPARSGSTPRAASNAGAPFATLWEFAVALNRSEPAAVAVASDSVSCPIPIEGADVKKLLGTMWFRSVAPQLSPAWRGRLLDALRGSLEVPNHVVKVGRLQARLSELGLAQLREASTSLSLPDAVRPDLELLVTIGRVWGEEALRQCRFSDVPEQKAPVSGLAGLLQGFKAKASRMGDRSAS